MWFFSNFRKAQAFRRELIDKAQAVVDRSDHHFPMPRYDSGELMGYRIAIRALEKTYGLEPTPGEYLDWRRRLECADGN